MSDSNSVESPEQNLISNIKGCLWFINHIKCVKWHFLRAVLRHPTYCSLATSLLFHHDVYLLLQFVVFTTSIPLPLPLFLLFTMSLYLPCTKDNDMKYQPPVQNHLYQHPLYSMNSGILLSWLDLRVCYSVSMLTVEQGDLYHMSVCMLCVFPWGMCCHGSPVASNDCYFFLYLYKDQIFHYNDVTLQRCSTPLCMEGGAKSNFCRRFLLTEICF